MTNLIDNHTGQAFQSMSIEEALLSFKQQIETAILSDGEKGKNNVIRSQKPIKTIHDAVKTEFLKLGVHPSLINPGLDTLKRLADPGPRQRALFASPYKLEDKELGLTGYLKNKNQDVSIVPKDTLISAETITHPTYVYGENDPYGEEFTKQVISVNVRSQLSSIAKNFDTLYERTFAEALNFHLRSGSMVLGEVYLIVAKPYHVTATSQKKIGFEKATGTSFHIDKYIRSFQALNDRSASVGFEHQYERVALLVVDFEPDTPKLYNTTAELIQDGYLSHDSKVDMSKLSFGSFAPDIMRIYNERYPNNRFS